MSHKRSVHQRVELSVSHSLALVGRMDDKGHGKEERPDRAQEPCGDLLFSDLSETPAHQGQVDGDNNDDESPGTSAESVSSVEATAAPKPAVEHYGFSFAEGEAYSRPFQCSEGNERVVVVNGAAVVDLSWKLQQRQDVYDSENEAIRIREFIDEN